MLSQALGSVKALLRSLRIRDLVIVDDLSVEFGEGLTLLTGETGAGKSILVDALGLAVGHRADRSLVRAGAERAVVEALFDLEPGSDAATWLGERGLDDGAGAGQLAVRREIGAAGTGRLWLNGSPATVGMLAELGPLLLEVHGQHEQQSLLRAESHGAALDRYAGLEARASELREVHAAVRAAREERTALERDLEQRLERTERLRALVREIEGLAPRAGEQVELDAERAVLRSGAEVRELLDQLVELTYEGERGAAALAALAARRAERLAEIDSRVGEIAARLRAAAVEIQDVGATLRERRDGLDFDPARLEALEERRAAISRLTLRLGVDEAGLIARREEALGELAALADLDGARAHAAERVAAVEREYGVRAIELGAARRGAAERLGPAVERELRALALAKARFAVRFEQPAGERVAGPDGTSLALTPRGAERAEFLLAANPGEAFRPLGRVASGGELSRVMLSLHAVLGRAAGDRILVFDEIDAGVGGAVADAVGARLGRLARRQQVLCVTHLPQVAAYADHHLRVVKSVDGGRTSTEVARLDASARVEELARMLGGRRSTPASRRHAAELLEAARRTVPGVRRDAEVAGGGA